MLYRLEISAAKFQERAGVQVGVPNAPLPTQEMALEVCFDLMNSSSNPIQRRGQTHFEALFGTASQMMLWWAGT
jgi:hypothetical protein